LEEVNNELSAGQLRKILGSFLFSGDDVFKKIGVLSGGEKSRVALSRLLLTKSNFIILDEPTNHLDFSSKQILQKALMDFTGTLLIVSHDIDFIRPIVNRVVEIRNGNLKTFPDGIDYYLQKRIEQKVEDAPAETNENKSNRKDQKRIEAELRQKRYNQTKDLRNELELYEIEIHKLEESKTSIEYELTIPQIYSNPALSKEKKLEYEKVKTSLENKYERWTELSHKLEEIEKLFN
jgi:ATP-binding cassette subfamily F protein 3